MGASTAVSAAADDNGKKLFISKLKSEFMKSPLASNVFLGLILTGLEKVVDVEFACPCDPVWNRSSASAYISLPGITASVLMLAVQGMKWKDWQDRERFVLFGLVPAMMWLILVFLDGQYYACAMTNWTGRFVIVDKAEPQRWCEPTNGTLYMERMSQTQQWYFHSQGIGIFILLGCVILIGGFKFCSMLCNKIKERPTDAEEPAQKDKAVDMTEMNSASPPIVSGDELQLDCTSGISI